MERRDRSEKTKMKEQRGEKERKMALHLNEVGKQAIKQRETCKTVDKIIVTDQAR